MKKFGEQPSQTYTAGPPQQNRRQHPSGGLTGWPDAAACNTWERLLHAQYQAAEQPTAREIPTTATTPT